LSITSRICFLLYLSCVPRVPHPFPTRRSSDLAMLMKEAPGTALAEFDNPAIIDLSSWWSEHLPDPVPPVRIGRYSRDHVMKFPGDRKSTRLNSSHVKISYAVFCLKKKIRIVTP